MRKNILTGLFMGLSLLPGASMAATATHNLTALSQEVLAWLDASLANSPGAVSYELRPIDSRLKLDACKKTEISLPAGYRLIGNTMLKVRCIDGANWNINQAVKIAITVKYVVAARPLAANQEINPSDVAIQQGDLGTLPGSVVMDVNNIVGRTLNSPVAAGQALRQEQLRASLVIMQNQKVKIIYRHDGIEISNEGIAMHSATEGQPVRIRIDKNKILSGIAQQGAIVEVSP